MAPPADPSGRDYATPAAGGDAVIAALQAEITVLRAENSALTKRLTELERRLGLNSSNSGKPPSSDGLKKPPRVSSLREPSGKKTGGQKGHPGTTLCRVEKPDATIEHYPEACAACGEPLTTAMASGHVSRQVFDLPEPRPLLVTEHRAYCCRCAACGTQTRAAFPEGVAAPAQYGKRIGPEDAHAAYDRREQELTPDLMREIERRVVLSVLDRKWREHLYEMDYLREGIGLRGWRARPAAVPAGGL